MDHLAAGTPIVSLGFVGSWVNFDVVQVAAENDLYAL
jgi:hypothetical protein